MKWTSLRIAKPQAFTTVLLGCDGLVQSGYVSAGGEPRWHNMLIDDKPTHWMPVPKSPKKTAKKKG